MTVSRTRPSPQGGVPPADLRARREIAEGFVALATEPDGIAFTAVDTGSLQGLWAEPVEGPLGGVVLYLHGGGYVSGSSASHRRLGGHLARAAGCRVFLLDYGRAPEHPHPGPVQDCLAAYRWLLADGVPPDSVAVAGDSSGGGLALATLLAIRDAGLPGPATGVTLSAWTDLEVLGESVTANASTDLVVTVDRLRELAAVFLGGSDVRDPLAAPLHGDYRGLPPLYLQAGGSEVLLSDSLRVAEAARAAGVEVRVDVFPGMQHVFQMRVGNSTEADDAVARIGAWLRPRLGLT